MMRRTDIIQWGVDHPWQNENQIEQDLLLSMAMVEVANDPLLAIDSIAVSSYGKRLIPFACHPQFPACARARIRASVAYRSQQDLFHVRQ